MRYEKKIDAYNFGTILRISPKVEYEEKTTIFGIFPAPNSIFPSEVVCVSVLTGQCPGCSFLRLSLRGTA